MPTNLYGPNDNFDLEKSHVLPGLLRKIHLGTCLERNNWRAIRKDLDRRPLNGISGAGSEASIREALASFGIVVQSEDKATGSGVYPEGDARPALQTHRHRPATITRLTARNRPVGRTAKNVQGLPGRTGLTSIKTE